MIDSHLLDVKSTKQSTKKGTKQNTKQSKHIGRGSLFSLLGMLALLSTGLPLSARAGQLPPDVRPTHWAAPFVEETLANHLLSLPDGKEFHGEAKVTHVQAVFALAKLAQKLEAGEWKPHASRPVSDKVLDAVVESDWRTQKVTRYEFAKVLASIANYVANGLPRPAASAKDLGKSTVLGPKPTITLDKSNPAYAPLAYLVEAHMLTKESPLLLTDKLINKPLLGGELSHAVTEMVIGITNRATELGKDENGETPDITSINRKKAKDQKK